MTGGKRTALPRQQTLKALIDWSYELLTEEERTLWRRLSVFTGGWTLEAAEEICSDEKIQKEKVIELSEQLTEKSIIVFDSEKDRYRILETLKQYGYEKLKEGKESKSSLAKHLHYFMKLSETGELKLKGVEEKIWLEKLEADHSNLQSAIEFSAREGDRNEGARLAAALQIFWSIRGHLSTGRRLLESILVDHRDLSKGVLGKVKSRIGSQLVYLSEFERAKKYLEESLALFREAEDKKGIADSNNGLGNVISYLGDYEQAKKLFEENILIGKETGDKTILAVALNNLGNLEYVQGNLELARKLYEESLALRREAGNKQGIAIALYNLGNITMDQGKYEESRRFFEQSLEVSREIGEKRMLASSLNCLGGIASVQEDFENARKLIEESLKINREIGEQRNIARSLSFLGRLEQNLENYEEALNIFNETLALTSQINEKNGIAFALNDLGNVFYLQGNYEQACKYYEESLQTRQELGEKIAIALSLKDLGNALYSLGDHKKAKTYYQESMSYKIEKEEMNHIPYVLVGIAGVFAENNPSLSLKMLGAADADLKSVQNVFDKVQRKLQEQIVNKLRGKLSEEEFSRYFEEGKKLTIEEAEQLAVNS